ncbi:MAG: preprotein translocase subunit SecG [Bacillota bacterium]
MGTLDIILRIFLVLLSIFSISVVLMQSEKGDGGFASTFAGGQSNMLRSGKLKGSESRLVFFTKVGCILLIIVSVAMVLYNHFAS